MIWHMVNDTIRIEFNQAELFFQGCLTFKSAIPWSIIWLPKNNEVTKSEPELIYKQL